jgi:hypothetical protein
MRTFLWMAVALAGFSVRSECAGVTSFVRSLWLTEKCYERLLHLFHTAALPVEKLTSRWVRLMIRVFAPLTENDRLVLIADGLKAPKEGQKMPAVKKLHQESTDNSKPAYIFGHSFQALGMLVRGRLGHIVSVPICSRIHEGLQRAPVARPRKITLLDKLASLFLGIAEQLPQPAYLLADAYYATRKVILPLIENGHHLVTRAKSNCVAYHAAPPPRKRGRGRPRLYGAKIRLRDLWAKPQRKHFKSAPSPVYGERDVQIRYRAIDLLWRPVGRLVRFVLVDHPNRGRMILLTTDLELCPIRVIALYGYRFKIEASFKQAVHTLGAYAYHFWMLAMTPISRRRSGDQYLHRRSDEYRRLVFRKIDAYHRFVQLAAIAQGLQQYLALSFQSSVWAHFRSWMRTMNPSAPPSEAVVAQALRNTLPTFLAVAPLQCILKKFLWQQMDPTRCPDLTLAG